MVQLPALAVAKVEGGNALAVPGLEIISEVGRGTHAVVYRARHEDRDFALNVLRPSDDQTHATVAFRREAGLVACVNHPGVAHVHEVGEVDGRPYLVMDLIEGEPLSPGSSTTDGATRRAPSPWEWTWPARSPRPIRSEWCTGM